MDQQPRLHFPKCLMHQSYEKRSLVLDEARQANLGHDIDLLLNVLNRKEIARLMYGERRKLELVKYCLMNVL